MRAIIHHSSQFEVFSFTTTCRESERENQGQSWASGLTFFTWSAFILIPQRQQHRRMHSLPRTAKACEEYCSGCWKSSHFSVISYRLLWPFQMSVCSLLPQTAPWIGMGNGNRFQLRASSVDQSIRKVHLHAYRFLSIMLAFFFWQFHIAKQDHPHVDVCV